jgi:GxxExxY protein
MYTLTEKEKALCAAIVDSAFRVHHQIGPGLLEKVYEACFCYELSRKDIFYQRQIDVPIRYDSLYFEEGFRMDVFVDDTIICELKAVDQINPLWQAQLLSHLRMTGKHVGFLINFDVMKIKVYGAFASNNK